MLPKKVLDFVIMRFYTSIRISISHTLTVTAPAMMPSTVDFANGSNDLSAWHIELGFNMYLQECHNTDRMCSPEWGGTLEAN